ncbi:MEDS domain-containing protein [Saccharomonospora sp.]|uniref:MEDS domain-containing protein n=1 Tax=Saccharomonospora sp. TaxID=33913 RepID=UPI002613BEAD|nr:MEDS domain-containing protein [Saccharomonospora sp.]
MRRKSALVVPVGYGWHDHACWFHTGIEAWREMLVLFFSEGAVRRERLLYISDRSEDELAEDLSLLPARDELLSSGHLQLWSSSAVHGATDEPTVLAQAARMRQAADDAVAAGYRCLRLAVDAALPIRDSADAAHFVHSEMVFDEVAARSPVLLLCGYDGRYVDQSASAALAFVHPMRQRAVFGPGCALYADSENAHSWRLQGELDLASREVLEIALNALPVHGDVHLRLDGLSFIDVSGTHALARLAERIAPHRLVLHDPPTALSRIVEVSHDAFPSLRRVAAAL